MPEDPNSLTLALILTAAGATAASALVTGLVQMLKGIAGSILTGKERLTAFAISAVLVAIAFGSGVQEGAITISIASVFGAFLAWFNVARMAMAFYADATQEPNSLTGPDSP